MVSNLRRRDGANPATPGTGSSALDGSTGDRLHRRRMMTPRLRLLAAAVTVVGQTCLAQTASAQKSGGTFRIGHFDSPASMSMLEESTVAVNRPMMGVFNNLVLYDQ